MSDSDDEPITLSANALLALQQFKEEEKSRLESFQKLYKASEDQFDSNNAEIYSIDNFQEDWQLSQFWYNDETADLFAEELLDGADEDTYICIASAPSVYAALKRRPIDSLPTKNIYLLEYDRRFKLLAGEKHFAFYDYHYPTDIPSELKGKFHRLLIDPPFLEEECQLKSSLAAKALLVSDKTQLTQHGTLKYKLITSTGERMREIVKKNYPDTHLTTFSPEHKNGLSNEFACYSSYEGKNWKFK